MPLGDDGELEDLIVADGRSTHGPQGSLEVLLTHRVDHVLRGDAQGGHLLRLDPDAHRVIEGAELVGLTDPRHPCQLVLDVDGGKVGEEEGALAVVRGIDVDHQQQVGGLGLDRHPQVLDLGGQQGQGLGDPVLGVDLGDVRVRAHGEGHRQGIGPRGGGDRGHVEHVLYTVDLLLDGATDGAGDGLGVGAGIGGVDHDHRRGDVGVLGDGDGLDGQEPGHHQDDGDDRGQPWPLDEDPGDHGRCSAWLPSPPPAFFRVAASLATPAGAAGALAGALAPLVPVAAGLDGASLAPSPSA